MSENLQKLLKEALLNNSYDYDVMHNTLKNTLMNSYSYLYYLQNANIGYEELIFFSNDVDSRNSELIGKLYLDKSLNATFDVDYDLISLYSREEFRLSEFYGKSFTYMDMVYNPEIFYKLPVVIIDDKLIWDYSVSVKKDCTTFTLPFKRNFVIKDERNKITDDIIYVDHKIQVMVIDNIFYQRYTFNRSTLNFNKANKTITISKANMRTNTEKEIIRSVNTEYMSKYGVKFAADLTSNQQYEIIKETRRRQEVVKIPEQDGIMFISLHFLNEAKRGYELGTSLIHLYDDGNGNYVGHLTDDLVDILSNHTYDIYGSMIFFNRLYEHEFYDGSKTTISTDEGADLLVLEDKHGIPYKSPIPVENCIVMKRKGESGWFLEKNTDCLEMHYPNIYRIKDERMDVNDEYHIYYFYYENADLQYTVLFDFYFKFLMDIFPTMSMEKIINDIYYNKADLSFYTEDEKEIFMKVFNRILDYKFHHHQYGDTDFVNRYLKIEGNKDKEPIEYKDETLKEWIRVQPWVLRDYVLEQNKLGDSYHLFTNTLNLEERIRIDTSIELGDKHCKKFDEPRYVFAFSNERDFPELLDCRVFVDGLLIGDVYQYRKLFMDYFYIPVKDVTHDSYIELEIFPRYKFTKDIEFKSMDDSIEITIAEPEENIYPTTADIIIQKDMDDVKYKEVEASFIEGYRLDMNGEVVADDRFFLGTLNVAEKDVALESTFLVGGPTFEYPVYTFFDNDGKVISMNKNKIYNSTIEFNSFRCYGQIPEGTTCIKVCCYKPENESVNLHDYIFKITQTYIPMDNIAERYSLNMFNIISHYDRGNFEFSSDDESKPVKFTRLSTFEIQPKLRACLNKPMKLKFSKIPIMIRFTVDAAGYAYIETAKEDFKYNTEYIRVYRNGRLIPKNRYRLLTIYERPRLVFLEWFDIGDIVYIDITPYRYTQIYHKNNISKKDTLIDLRSIINKPFDIRYYDVYMNGRKLSLNNVFSITPWEITLVNLKSNYNLDIYEKERDWEYFGLDYNENIYYFSFDNLINSGIVSDEEFCKLIKDRIDELKDTRLNIYPNTFDEEPLDYSDVDMIYPIFFIFYYDHLVPKTYVNPDILQLSEEVMVENFTEVYENYLVVPSEQAMSERERLNKLDHPKVICLDPDVYIPSTGQPEDRGVHIQIKDKVRDDYYYDEDGNLVIDAERTPDKEPYSEKDNPLIYNMDDQATADESEAEFSDGVILVYDVGHTGDLDQKFLDEEIEILSENNFRKGDD